MPVPEGPPLNPAPWTEFCLIVVMAIIIIVVGGIILFLSNPATW